MVIYAHISEMHIQNVLKKPKATQREGKGGEGRKEKEGGWEEKKKRRGKGSFFSSVVPKPTSLDRYTA